MSIAKYVGEQGGQHNGSLLWPGFAGLPVRGHNQLLKTDELEELFEVSGDFGCREFDLTIPEQKVEYEQIMDRIVNGWYRRQYWETWRHPETHHRMIYIEWVQRYGHFRRRDPLSKPGA